MADQTIAAGGQARDAIDCDVHCAPESMDVLTPYLDDYWRSYIDDATIRLADLAYPPGAATSGPAPRRRTATSHRCSSAPRRAAPCSAASSSTACTATRTTRPRSPRP
jgi:hypothetical protein